MRCCRFERQLTSGRLVCRDRTDQLAEIGTGACCFFAGLEEACQELAESCLLAWSWSDQTNLFQNRISVGQAHAGEQLSEARVVAQGLEPPTHFEICKFRVTVLVSLFQPDESFVQLTQGSIENRD